MSRSNVALVSPHVLSWARKVVRMGEQESAKKVGVTAERLAAWEQGTSQPTVRQARLLAHAYRVPFATFYLADPPAGITRLPKDLRRHAGEFADGPSPAIQLDVRDAWERREIALELATAAGISVAPFGYSADIGEDPEVCGARLRFVLDARIDDQMSWRDLRIGFNRWRQLAEEAGVLVLQTSDIALSELRAYSLAADVLPVVVVNRKDPYPARSFSLLHELAHLGLHSDGICDLRTDDARPPEEQQLEVFCNAVAAAALIPRDSLLEQPEVALSSNEKWDDDDIAALAKRYSCSREALLRRLLTFGRTSYDFYRLKREQYQREYAERPPTKGFVTPAVDAVSILGRPLVRLILDGLANERITTSDAADYLGVRLKHLPAISAAVGEGDK